MASLLLDPCVGEAVALGDTERASGSAERIAAAADLQTGHPAVRQLRKMKLVPTKKPAKKAAKKRAPRKKKS